MYWQGDLGSSPPVSNRADAAGFSRLQCTSWAAVANGNRGRVVRVVCGMNASRDVPGPRGIEGHDCQDAVGRDDETAGNETACEGAAHRTWADAVRCSWNWANQRAQPEVSRQWSTSPVASPPQSPELDGLSPRTATVDTSSLADVPRMTSILDTSASESEDEEAAEQAADVSAAAAADGSDDDDESLHNDSLGLEYLTIEDDPKTAGAPGWLLGQLQLTSVEHTCTAGFLQMGMERCYGNPDQDSSCTDELPPEGWETRRSRRDGRSYFFNVETGESRWPRQRRSSTDRELAAGRCKACRAEWIALHDGSQHRRAPTAREAIELAQRRLSADNAARRTLAYQLLALSAVTHVRLGNGSVACGLPFDLQEKIGRSLNWRHVGAAAATQFMEQ
eukprot:COSAG02_NODE_7358_length_3048_cov_2.484271_3_plen_391_part_01